MKELLLYVLGYLFAFAFGFVIGKWEGFKDAQPKRDKTGRFTKEQ